MGTRSRELFAEALRYIPGGVNSPVRAFRAVGGEPLFISHASGSKLYDADGKEYIDYVASWGPLVLGHAHPEVVEAIREAAGRGTSYGAPTALETEMARLIVESVPSVEVVRLVNSGTEATMSAIRLSRGVTGRKKIVKFEGCYHGHADSLLVKAGSGATTFGVPDSAGVPPEVARFTLNLPFNDADLLGGVMEKEGGDVACVIVEPVAGNMGVIPPRPGFLGELRRLTREHGTLLIFDEVITGFRLGLGGAQALYGVEPDLTCLGKIIGGGLPVGAYGGRREVMEAIAPGGGVYQAGTLSGNPLAMAAGLATLRVLSRPGMYEELEAKAESLSSGLKRAAEAAGVAAFFTRVGSLMGLFFTGEEVADYAGARTSDTERFARYFRALLEEGVYVAPSQFEASFMSLAHTQEDIERTVAAAEKAFSSL